MGRVEDSLPAPEPQTAPVELFPRPDQTPFEFVRRHSDGSVSYAHYTDEGQRYTDLRALWSPDVPDEGIIVQAHTTISNPNSRQMFADTYLHVVPDDEDALVHVTSIEKMKEIPWISIIHDSRMALQLINQGLNIPSYAHNGALLRIEDLDIPPAQDILISESPRRESTDRRRNTIPANPSSYPSIEDFMRRRIRLSSQSHQNTSISPTPNKANILVNGVLIAGGWAVNSYMQKRSRS